MGVCRRSLLIPVVWLALLTAPCLGGSIVDVMKRLAEAIKSPLHIVWCENSFQSFLNLFRSSFAQYPIHANRTIIERYSERVSISGLSKSKKTNRVLRNMYS